MEHDNPYDPPDETSARTRVSQSTTPWWMRTYGIVLLAALAGVGIRLMFFNFRPLALPLSVIFFVSPVLALVIATSMGLNTNSPADLVRRVVQSMRFLATTVAILVAGWIAFAATCCCTNVFDFISMETNTGRRDGMGVRTLLFTFVSTLVGAWVVYGLNRRRTIAFEQRQHFVDSEAPKEP